jgi:hypothetical protein
MGVLVNYLLHLAAEVIVWRHILARHVRVTSQKRVFGVSTELFF